MNILSALNLFIFNLIGNAVDKGFYNLEFRINI